MTIRNTLIKGQTYKKTDFGINGDNLRRTDQLVKGEHYSFFNLFGERENDNKLESDGFVYGVSGNNWALIEPTDQTNLHRHIFVKRTEGSDYEYIGETTHERRYDDTHNKAFF